MLREVYRKNCVTEEGFPQKLRHFSAKTLSQTLSFSLRLPQKLCHATTAPGAARAIVVGGVDITRAAIEYQCPLGQNAVLRNGESPTVLGTLTQPDAQGPKYTCNECNRSTRMWWYTTDSINYVLLTETDFQARVAVQGEGYVASCSS